MNDIMRFIAKRLCIGVLVVLFVTVLVFAIMQAMQGNPIDLMVDTRVSAEKVAEIKAQWGLDEPPVVQYFYWIKNVLHGDFGTSISLKTKCIRSDSAETSLHADAYRRSTSDRIHNRDSARLIGGGQKNSAADKSLTVMTIVLWSMPPFWLGVLFILTFSVWLKILPISGWDGFASLILPAFTLALPALAQIFRLTRSEVLDVLDEKYVTTAYAKGLKNKVVLVKHRAQKRDDSGHRHVLPVATVADWRRGRCRKCFRVAGHGTAHLESDFQAGFCYHTGRCFGDYDFDRNL